MTEPLRWKGYYRPIVDGTAVKASVTNVPVDDLWQNMLYLKHALDTSEAGRALVLSGQTISNLAVVGTPVYLTATGIWQPALAELSNEPNSSLFTLTEKAYVAGMVTAKNSAGIGDVAIQGQITFPSTFTAVIEGTYASGALYYLSPYTAGKINASKGIAPVRVCLVYGPDANGEYRVIINPDQRTQLEAHGHYHFELVDAPAGEANCVPGKSGFMWGDLEPDGPYPGVVHEVRDADVALPGWLPATSTYFPNMNIPVGAKFGYNLPMDPELAAVWPPLPITGVEITVDGVGEISDLIEVNSDGIWWMTDVYGKAPWPVNLPCPNRVPGLYPNVDGSSSGTSYDIWPVRIELWMTKMLGPTTIAALNNQIDLKTAALPALNPTAVGTDFSLEVIPGSAVRVYGIGLGSETSSSTGSPESSNALYYQLDTRAFTVVGGLTPKVAIEVVVGGNALFTDMASAIINGLRLRINRLTPAEDGEYVAYASAHVHVPWTIVPTIQTEVPADKYFVLRTDPLTLVANEQVYLQLYWVDEGLTDPAGRVLIYTVRPIITV